MSVIPKYGRNSINLPCDGLFDRRFFVVVTATKSFPKHYIMSTEQTAFFLQKTTSEKRRAKAFGAFAGSVTKRT